MVVLAARWLKSRRKQNGENKSLLSKCRQAETEIGEKRKQQLGRQVRNSTPGRASLARNPEIKPQHDEQPEQQNGSAGKGKTSTQETCSLGMNLQEARLPVKEPDGGSRLSRR
jgi:hypothetical protein